MAASYSIVCQTCGKEFTIEKRRLETAKCCSIPCERARAAVPEEQKRALSIARTGKRLSLEHRAKMSAAAKGRKPHNMKPVRVGGAEYPSVAHAVKALGRSKKWLYSQIEKGGAEYVERK